MDMHHDHEKNASSITIEWAQLHHKRTFEPMKFKWPCEHLKIENGVHARSNRNVSSVGGDFAWQREITVDNGRLQLTTGDYSWQREITE